METKGIIKEITHPTAVVNPVVLVEKKNKDLRLCLDLRKLNKSVLREQHAIPTVDDIARTLGGKVLFTVLDLKDGYYHIKLDKASADLCTFGTIYGRYSFQRMPFGIRSASEIFQRHVYSLFGDIPGVCVYFDDLLVSGASEKEHDEALRQVFERARKYNVRFNASKIQYRQDSVKYLGQIFSKHGVAIDEKYIEAIKGLPDPQNKSDVLRVLGMIKFVSKFVPSLSEISAPLRELTKADTPWHWGVNEKKSLCDLREAVLQAPILAYFDSQKMTEIHVDASNGGLGGCLFQEGRPVAFASRSLTITEQRYAIIEKELLAVYFGVMKFHHFIYGKNFLIVTDHKPLVSICKKDLNSLSPRLQRIRLKLLNYEFDIQFKPGREMIIPDTLSRLQLQTTEPASNIEFVVHAFMKTLPISCRQRDRFLIAMRTDVEMTKLKEYIEEGWPAKVSDGLSKYPRDEITECEGLFVWNNRIVVPRALRSEMLDILHSSHAGVEKTKERAKQTVIWPQINKDIDEYISKCHACQKFSKRNAKQPLLSHPVPIRPWQRIFIDIMTHNSKDYLIIVDAYSFWIEVSPLRNKSAQEVISNLKLTFSRFGIPEVVVSDNVPFASTELMEFSKRYDFDIRTRSPNYAQSNSYAERAVGIIKNIFKKTSEANGDFFLGLMEYRNTPLKKVNLSPAQLLMNRTCRTKLPATPDSLSPKINQDVPQKLEEKLLVAKRYYDKSARNLRDLEPGQEVVIEYPNDDRWHYGRIVQKHKEAPRSYIVKDEETGRVVRRNRRQLRSRVGSIPAKSTPSVETASSSSRDRRERRMPTRLKDYCLS